MCHTRAVWRAGMATLKKARKLQWEGRAQWASLVYRSWKTRDDVAELREYKQAQGQWPRKRVPNMTLLKALKTALALFPPESPGSWVSPVLLLATCLVYLLF